MFSGYSPLFTAGLLNRPESSTSSSTFSSASYPSELDIHSLGPRRGSLPDTRSPTIAHDESAAFYFTMQPKRDVKEFRSFLSLDLAESHSMRSASLKRKASSKVSNNWLVARIPENPKAEARVPSPVQTPLHPRFSRESTRSIPSPKPAPSMNLPEVPKSSTPAAPRLPSIPKTPTLSLNFSSPKQSFLPSLRISRSKAPKTVVRLPLNRASVATTSTVSTTTKRVNRSNALARLEGRKRAPAPLKPTGKNFMSLSEDESSDDESDMDIDSHAPRSDSFDLTDGLFYAAFFEPEDLVLPSTFSVPSSPISDSPISPLSRRNSTSPVKPSFRRRPTLPSRRSTKDWFPPMKSFMDLKSDDENQQPSSGWSWRSFIDVAGMS